MLTELAGLDEISSLPGFEDVVSAARTASGTSAAPSKTCRWPMRPPSP